MIKLTETMVSFTKEDIQNNLVKSTNSICNGSFGVLTCILSHAVEKEGRTESQVSLKTLVGETGFSIVKVWSCIQALIRRGALEKTGHWGKDKPLVYVINKDLFED